MMGVFRAFVTTGESEWVTGTIGMETRGKHALDTSVLLKMNI